MEYKSRRLLTIILLLISSIFFVSCKNTDNSSSDATRDYYSKLGYYEITLTENIFVDFDEETMISLENGNIMIKPNKTIIAYTKLNSSSSKTSDVQHETINFVNSTFLSGIKANNKVYTFAQANTGIKITENTTLSLAYSEFTISGVAIYQKINSHENLNKYNESETYVQSALKFESNNLNSADILLTFVYFNTGLNNANMQSSQSNSTFKIKDQSATNIDIAIEIYTETTSFDSYLILLDDSQNLYLYKHTDSKTAEDSSSFGQTNGKNSTISTVTISTNYDISTT